MTRPTAEIKSDLVRVQQQVNQVIGDIESIEKINFLGIQSRRSPVKGFRNKSVMDTKLSDEKKAELNDISAIHSENSEKQNSVIMLTQVEPKMIHCSSAKILTDDSTAKESDDQELN